MVGWGLTLQCSWKEFCQVKITEMPGKKKTSSTLSVLLILAVLSFCLCNISIIQDLSYVLSPSFTQQALQMLSIRA